MKRQKIMPESSSQGTASNAVSQEPNSLPGFGLPMNFQPEKYFPTALPYEKIYAFEHRILTLRERTMEAFMNSITDKPDWHIKIYNKDIADRWRKEALANEQSMTSKMVDWCEAEIAQEKAEEFKNSGIIRVFDLGVFKSDVAVDESIRKKLIEQVLPLENGPKDWHPGSNEQVLDLVHPSLYPLVYGKTKILPKGLTTMDDCIRRSGDGVTAPEIQEETKQEVPIYGRQQKQSWSHKYQWLPCEVSLTGGNAHITSYINNLHPQRNRGLYPVIDQIISRVIPMWERSLSMPKAMFATKRRIDDFSYDYEYQKMKDNATDENDREWYKPSDDEQYEFYDRYEEENESGSDNESGSADERSLLDRRSVIPEPQEYKKWAQRVLEARWSNNEPYETPKESNELPYGFVKLGKKDRLQIIVKLASIYLTPDKPRYEGGTWHVEGQLNEHICASAIYYYDCQNITETRLAFRGMMESPDAMSSMNEMEDYGQSQLEAPQDIYGFTNEESQVLSIGEVVTKQGRVITFPNTMQHQVQSFSLQDQTMPGHRKILALFLVDPNIPIISTGHVPCQQAAWWLDNAKDYPGLHKMPNEVRDVITSKVNDSPITESEAKKIREEMMEERKVFDASNDSNLNSNTFSLCEH